MPQRDITFSRRQAPDCDPSTGLRLHVFRLLLRAGTPASATLSIGVSSGVRGCCRAFRIQPLITTNPEQDAHVDWSLRDRAQASRDGRAPAYLQKLITARTLSLAPRLVQREPLRDRGHSRDDTNLRTARRRRPESHLASEAGQGFHRCHSQ